MSTPYDEVFKSFTSKITDPIFKEMPVDDSEAQMIQLLDDGLIYFKNPKIDVFDKDNDLKQFNVDLNYHEIQIIGNLMKLAWIDRQISNLNLIKQRYTDRDFKLTSQAEHLAQLLKLRQTHEDVCQKIIRRYTYSKTGNKPNFDNLAGGHA